MSARLLSKTVMPWRAWSSACCNWSRLDWIAAEASSSSFSADLPDMARRRSSSDSTRREVEAPIAGDSRCSAWRIRCASASSAGVQVEAALALKRLEGAPRPLRAEIARDRRLEFAVVVEARHSRKACGLPLGAAPTKAVACMRSSGVAWRVSETSDERQHVEAERQRDAADQRIGGEAGQRRRPQPGEAERPVGDELRERAFAVERGQQQQIEPRREPDRPCRPPRRARCRAARRGRRGRPDRSAPRRRRTAARSRRAPPRRSAARRDSRASARRESRGGARSAPVRRSRPPPLRRLARRGRAAGSA